MRTSRKRSGTAAVEFAVILPLVAFLLLGLWEAGRMLEVQQLMNNAAREGARLAAGGQMSKTEVQQGVVNYLKSAGVSVLNSDLNAVVTVKNLGFTGNPAPADDDPQNAYYLDQMQITVMIPNKDVRWVASNLVLNPDSTLTATATWSSMRDKPFPTIDFPAGN